MDNDLVLQANALVGDSNLSSSINNFVFLTEQTESIPIQAISIRDTLDEQEVSREQVKSAKSQQRSNFLLSQSNSSLLIGKGALRTTSQSFHECSNSDIS